MKRIIFVFVAALTASSLFAYNPPFAGEDLYRLASPDLMTGAASASGGPLFSVTALSSAYNPALTALSQRINLDLSGTMFFNTNKNDLEQSADSSVGGAFQVGLIVPSKWVVFSGDVHGIFSDINGLNVRDVLTLRFGVSKEVNEKLSVGMNMYTGFYIGEGSDFAVGADLGALYVFDDIKFLKSPRLGVAFLNLGKPAVGYDVIGIDVDAESSGFPGIVTPRVSFAATLFDVKKLTGGFSVDLSVPTFQNAVFDFGFGLSYAKIAELSVSWQANVREMAAGGSRGVSCPSVGLSFKFAINSSGISKKNDNWAKSEISPSFAWQNLYGGIHAVSAGAKMDLGMEDTDAPEIYLWDEE